jgi:predicted AAA+ superfamily ATPase
MAREEIKNYIARQLSEQAKVLGLSAFDQKGHGYLKRFFYYRIEKFVREFLASHGEPRWIIIPGLRGVGKTTVLAQIFFQYSGAFGKNILYVSLDDVTKKLGSNLFEVLDAYEELIATSFSQLKEDVLLLVDEVHFDPEWQFALKSLYDRSRRVFIISTGSSAIALNMTTDVARRSHTEKMYPLKFTEYVMISDSVDQTKDAVQFPPKLGERLAMALFESENAQDALENLQKISGSVVQYWQSVDTRAIDRYLKFYSTPSVLSYADDAAIYANLNSVIDRIIERDIPTMKPFTADIQAKIPALLFILAGSEAQSLEGMAGELKDIEVKTLSVILKVLEDAELLIRVYPYSASAPKKVRQPSKYLFLASSLRAALLHLIDSRSIDIQHKGKLLEDVVGMYLYRHFKNSIGWTMSYDAGKNGADFIVEGSKRIVVETGWNKRTHQQVVNTMERVSGATYGIVVTNSCTLGVQDNVLFVPFDYFFLL